MEAVAKSDILYLFGKGNCVFTREKSGNFETDVRIIKV